MSRLLLATFTFSALTVSSAVAQLTSTPGPGGTTISPGSPITGYTPGGIGPGGVEISPGPAARGIPMYREGIGGVPLPLRPDEPAPSGRGAVGSLDPGFPGVAGVRRGLPQSLILTINSQGVEAGTAPAADATIDSIDALFGALRACWEPPARDKAKLGTQMSVRFSYKRTGDMMGPPRVTYTTPGTQTATKDLYRNAINASLGRCAPLKFSKSFGAAIAGNPISIRYVDDRS